MSNNDLVEKERFNGCVLVVEVCLLSVPKNRDHGPTTTAHCYNKYGLPMAMVILNCPRPYHNSSYYLEIGMFIFETIFLKLYIYENF